MRKQLLITNYQLLMEEALRAQDRRRLVANLRARCKFGTHGMSFLSLLLSPLSALSALSAPRAFALCSCFYPILRGAAAPQLVISNLELVIPTAGGLK